MEGCCPCALFAQATPTFSSAGRACLFHPRDALQDTCGINPDHIGSKRPRRMYKPTRDTEDVPPWSDVADDGPQFCERCRTRMHHGHWCYTHCCKGCCNSGVCEADCVSVKMAALSQSEWLGRRQEAPAAEVPLAMPAASPEQEELFEVPWGGDYALELARLCEEYGVSEMSPACVLGASGNEFTLIFCEQPQLAPDVEKTDFPLRVWRTSRSRSLTLRMPTRGAGSQSDWLGGRLELYRHREEDGRLWICMAKAGDGCVFPWMYLDTLLECHLGRQRPRAGKIQVPDDRALQLEWLQGELEMYSDTRSGYPWICPAQSSEGSGYPWIYVTTLLQREGGEFACVRR